MDFFKENLQAGGHELKNFFQPEKENRGSLYSFQKARRRGFTLVRGKESLCSRYDPLAEAEKKYSSLKGKYRFLIFLGMGAGYVASQALSDPYVKRIIVLEDDKDLLVLLLRSLDLTHLFSDSRFSLWPFSRMEEAVSALDLLNLDTVRVYEEVDFIYEKRAGRLRSELKFLLDSHLSELFTRIRFGPLWFSNFRMNLKNYILKNISMPSAEKLKPVIAQNKDRIVFCGAGPSLQDQIQSLKNVRKRIFLVCADTSLRYLMSAGIVPDAAVSVDSQVLSAFHFKNIDAGNTIFFLDTLTHPSIARKLSGRSFFFCSGHPLNELWPEKYPAADSGLSVLHSSLDLLASLGAQKIFLAGVDLSYPDSKAYSGGGVLVPWWLTRMNRISSVETLYCQWFRQRKLHKALGEEGVDVLTTPVMILYARALENWIHTHPGTKIVRLRGKGLEVKGLERGSLPGSGFKQDVPENLSVFSEPVRQVSFTGKDMTRILDPVVYACLVRQKRRKRVIKDRLSLAEKLRKDLMKRLISAGVLTEKIDI